MADRIAMLYKGDIIALEKTDAFRRSKDPRVLEFLGSFAINDANGERENVYVK